MINDDMDILTFNLGRENLKHYIDVIDGKYYIRDEYSNEDKGKSKIVSTIKELENMHPEEWKYFKKKIVNYTASLSGPLNIIKIVRIFPRAFYFMSGFGNCTIGSTWGSLHGGLLKYIKYKNQYLHTITYLLP